MTPKCEKYKILNIFNDRKGTITHIPRKEQKAKKIEVRRKDITKEQGIKKVKIKSFKQFVESNRIN